MWSSRLEQISPVFLLCIVFVRRPFRARFLPTASGFLTLSEHARFPRRAAGNPRRRKQVAGRALFFHALGTSQPPCMVWLDTHAYQDESPFTVAYCPCNPPFAASFRFLLAVESGGLMLLAGSGGKSVRDSNCVDKRPTFPFASVSCRNDVGKASEMSFYPCQWADNT